MPQPGFFDLDERYARPNERDRLVKLNQIIDAGFVDVPRQRNSREENAQLKAGETPERFEAS